MKKQTILIVNEYFFPAFKAGGPIQSLTNLVVSLESQYHVLVFTSDSDLGDNKVLKGVKVNQWNSILLPETKTMIQVFYSSADFSNKELKELISSSSLDTIYLNGIYGVRFFIRFILLNRSFGHKLIICPRGMLQKGALAGKTAKKKIYLTALSVLGLLSNAYWHATNLQEKEDIEKYFPKNRGICIAENIPRSPVKEISFVSKNKGELRLLYLSLITEKKNLLRTLKIISKTDSNIKLDIYGPVKDKLYWEECLLVINQLKDKVQYHGDVLPIDVQNIMRKYHALILLTKGENFGHALFESLSVGRPIITSHYTPWVNLEDKSAGINVDIADIDNCLNAITKLAMMDNYEFGAFCLGAHQLAVDYYDRLDNKKAYQQLFG